MICSKCGADIPEGTLVCPVCDALLEAEEAAQAPEAADVSEETVDVPADMSEVGEHVFDEDAADDLSFAEGMEYRVGDEKAPKKKRGVLIAVVCVALAAAVAAGAWLLFFRKAPTMADRVVEMADCLSDNATDVAMETVGVAGDTAMLTVDGQEVTAEEYLYWLGNVTSYYEMISSYSGGTMDLTQEARDGVTWDEMLKLTARDNAALMAVVPALAEEYGVELTEEDLQLVVDNRANSIENAGGEEMYAYQLQAMGINDATALRVEAVTALYNKVRETFLDKAAGELTAEDVAAYAEENDLLRAKHILLLTKDMTTGESYDDAKIAEQKAKADDLLAQLRADPAKFDELMNANSEDPGLAASPDGYLFTAHEMVSEFEDGTRALGFGEISEVIESSYGYHIILRLDPDCDEVRDALAGEKFGEEVQARVDNAEIVESETYKSLTTAGYYEKLTAFQDGLARPQVVDQSQAELEGADQTQPTAEPETQPEPTAEPAS